MAIRANIKIDNKALQRVLDNFVERNIYKYEKAGLAALKEIREGAVGSWYNNGKGRNNHINNATFYKTEKQGTGRNSETVTITVTSYVNSELYKDIVLANQRRALLGNWASSVEQWKERHSKSGWTYYNKKTGVPQPAISMHYTTGEYLVYQLWDKGIVGLPAGARETGTGWVNSSPPIEREPMRDYVARQVFTKWEEEVVKQYKKI